MSALVMGDPVDAVIQYLRADHQVQSFSQLQLSTDLIGWDENSFWVTFQQTGGAMPEGPSLFLRKPHVQIDFYGAPGTRSALGVIGNTILAVLYEINSTGYRGPGVGIASVDLDMDLAWLPDPQTSKPRYTSSVSLVCVPSLVS